MKRDGQLVEEVYRVGGRYGAQIARDRRRTSRPPMPFATAPMAKALRALITFYRTGEDDRPRGVRHRLGRATRRRRSTRSTASSRSTSTRAASRARGRRSSSTSTTRRPPTIKKLAANAQWFEDHMPWDPKYRKPGVQGITANAIDVVIETGDSGPVTPIGINLPNDQAIREQYGSKSVSLSNVNEAYDKSTLAGVPERVLLDARGSRARREVGRARRRAD